MAAFKIILTKTLTGIFFPAIFLLVIQPVYSQELQWTSLTSFKEVRRMNLIDDTVYMATSGGLMILEAADVSTAGLQFTNVDGLGTTDITEVIKDASGVKWISGFGRLIRYENGIFEPRLFIDQDNNLLRLHSLVDDGNSIWVGSEIGLVLYSKTIDGGQIQDSYTLFGNLNPSPDVFDIFIDGDTIWLATSSGLAMADKSNPLQLKAPSFWTTYDLGTFAELANDTITRVEKFEGSIYIGTQRGMYRLERSVTDTFIVLPFGQTSPFTDLKVENDSLFFYSSAAFGVVKDSAAVTLSTTGLPSLPATGTSTGSFRWLNVDDIDIYQNSGGTYQIYPFTGTPGNDVTDLTVNAQGVITAGFNFNGAGRYANGQWSSIGLGKQSTVITLDPSGNAWIGTFGEGLWLNGDNLMVNYDENNTSMIGNNDGPAGPAFVVIADMVIEGNFLYAACFRALNIYPVAFVNLNNINSPSSWDSLGLIDGISNEFVTSIDARGQIVAIGTEDIGLYACNLNVSPADTSRDVCRLMTESNSFLISDVVRDVVFSPDGELWVATNFGISRYDFEIDEFVLGRDRFVDVTLPPGIGPDIRVMEFDSRGNLWAGAANGLVRFDAASGESETFNSFNSGLVSNSVRHIHYDEYTGRTYIATDAGISVIGSTIGTPTSELKSVMPFPNPFVIDSPDDLLEFNYAGSGIVNIYSAAGELVRELKIGQRWDGRNDRGEKVVSGVYLFVIADDEGNSGRGKILLIRR
ncbi:MAG: hypothetical protein IH931_05265 [candidate division Zixibacteria bacterium]|nr:hypothetical protein [candidate division Zixibacteria bacterium]